MLEKLFTTKMSADKKKLQNRFWKIRSHNGKNAKWVGVCLFGIVIVLVMAVSVIIAVKNSNDIKKENPYIMTDSEFFQYVKRPLGSIMADIDYADGKKLVFHYIDGFFVYDMEKGELVHKINLKKLNIAGHTQGDCFTQFNIDKDGNFAYLINDGNKELINNYDNYIINLETGEVNKGNMPAGTQLFTNYEDTFSTVEHAIGWASDRCITVGDEKTYFLSVSDSVIGAIKLYTVNHKDNDKVFSEYVFGNEYTSVSSQKLDIINQALNDGDEILVNSGYKWEVNGETVKRIINKLGETRQMKYIDVTEGNYDVNLYNVWSNDENHLMMFIIDNYQMKLVLSQRITLDEHKYFVNYLNYPTIPENEFYPQDIKDITDAELVIDGRVYPIIVRSNIEKIEQMLQSAKIIKGGTDCPFKAVLILTKQDGGKGIVTIATDSCAVFIANGSYYDYSDGDNSEMLSFFGIDTPMIFT